MFTKFISAKGIVSKYKIPYSTITHYTNLGLFTVVKRNGNRRLYNEKDVRARMGEISNLINEGYPLRLIRKKLLGY